MKRVFDLDTLLANIALFIVIGLFALVPITFSVFDPIKDSLIDFKYTDMLYSKFNKSENPDTNIVLVNIGHLSRIEIAEQINVINSFHPKVVAIDAYFSERKDNYSDSILADALSKTQNLVTAGYFDHNNKESDIPLYKESHSFFGDHTSGHANFFGKSSSISVVRKYSPTILHHDQEVNSFTSEIIRKSYPDKYTKNAEQDSRNINYTSRLSDFVHFDAVDIFSKSDQLSIIKDKIVILGYLGDPMDSKTDVEDKHFTPMNSKMAGRSLPDMFGVVIHANILKMVLEDNYLKKSPVWINWFLAFILSYFHLIVFIYSYLKPHVWYSLIVKVIQLISSVFLMFMSLYLYYYFNLNINIAPSLIAIVLSVEVIYFYDGLMIFLRRRYNFKTRFSGFSK
ncbi:CHASE2 domain-containing protein [Labilibacter marinus]|uniref:CHASE2 domain-containing protein n=1 Tax=Labilibacter marinus TaxID=1477105 RepID=UPI00094FDB04|nr:CHASE2 domain-containing protein [Labilibacter marinus]